MSCLSSSENIRASRQWPRASLALANQVETVTSIQGGAKCRRGSESAKVVPCVFPSVADRRTWSSSSSTASWISCLPVSTDRRTAPDRSRATRGPGLPLRSVVLAPEAVLADQAVHRGASEIERARGLRDVPVVPGQRAEQQVL